MQESAIKNLLYSNVNLSLSEFSNSLQKYKTLKHFFTDTIYKEDFENINSLWSLGGKNNQWKYLVFSNGNNLKNHCYGTNAFGNYENNADCWLLSPKIKLNNFLSCKFNFWIWNDVEDKDQNEIIDPVWIEISVNNKDFKPICKNIGGVNDDKDVPSFGGWSQIYLDLSDYKNKEVRIRFRFKSNEKNVSKGCYIDDFKIITKHY